MKYWHNEKLPHLPHMIVLNAGNEEKLLKFQKAAELKDEVRIWLDENVGHARWQQAPYMGIINFCSEELAMAFILRWS